MLILACKMAIKVIDLKSDRDKNHICNENNSYF